MQMDYDPSLVEKAVRLAARQDPDVERDLHAVIDPIYRMDDPEKRDRCFAEVFATWFRELRLDGPLVALLDERPEIRQRCSRCIVREAARRAAESAELFVRDRDAGQAVRTLIVQILPESLVMFEQTAPLLRRELLHVSDMLCDAFGYRSADLATLPLRDQIVRDRYRVLWDIYVESRLVREGYLDDRGFARLQRMFERAFACQGQDPPPCAFDDARTLRDTTHAELLEFARQGASQVQI